MIKENDQKRFAIVDIETTGGNALGSRMTEIAIILHDGEKELDRWHTLINPEQSIPLRITGLTGITDAMVEDAPVFSTIAEEVFSLLDGKIFVAHNVNFDYSFIRHQLGQCGYLWSPKKLCTVRLSRKVKPGLPSYSLGRLCDYLDIKISQRHRALGDAEATAELFAKMIKWDAEGVIEHMLKKSPEQRLPPNLSPKDFHELPNSPGVYYFLNKMGKVVYVGKALNIKKRVSSHFTGNNIRAQRQHFLKDIYSITFEACGTELMAFLLECAEIKRLWPLYNRALKRFEPKYGLFDYEGQNGYRHLAIGKLAKHQACCTVFQREYDGVKLLRELAERFELDYRYVHFGPNAISATRSTGEEMENLPGLADHNNRIGQALNATMEGHPSYMIMDRGRQAGEKSCILIKEGRFYGMGYIDEANQLSDVADMEEHLKKYSSNFYMQQLVSSFAKKNPEKVVWITERKEISGATSGSDRL